MGRWLVEEWPHLRRNYFDRADEILGFELSRLCLEGPEEELVKTENQQPAIYLVSVATNAALRERGPAPAAVAGHSLGEYSALVADLLRLLPADATRRLRRLYRQCRPGEMMMALLEAFPAGSPVCDSSMTAL